MIKGIVVGFILGVIVLAGGTYYYFASGMAPVADGRSDDAIRKEHGEHGSRCAH